MKEIVRVHLAKTPYSIEVDAKKELEAYLRGIERAMHADGDVMQEIEARLVELLAERGVHADGVISLADVTAVREHMGEPSDFSDDGAVPETELPEQSPIKRLMRDPDAAVLGGVCAGIAAYWGVNPLWVRLLFIISPFVSFGMSLLLYALLWLSVPPARTAAEKLQMRGEPVTLATLKETTAGQSVAKGVSAAAKGARFLLGGFLLLGTMGALIGLVVGSVFGISTVTAMKDFAAQPVAWGLLLSLMVGGVAAVWLGAALSYSAFSWTLKRPAVISMIMALVIGALCVSTTAIFGMQTATELAQDEKRLTKVVALPLPADDGQLLTVENRAPYVLANVRHEPGEPRAELRYISVGGDAAPRIKLSREGSRLVIHGADASEQCHSVFQFIKGSCYGVAPRVTVYGDKLRMEPTASRSDVWTLSD